MIRGLGVLLVAGVLLGACGSISASSAMSSWVTQSGYAANNHQLEEDAAHAATALEDADSSSAELRTVCAVLDLESEQANSSLPTPDNQTTNLLGRAYDTLGAAANRCYDAGANAALRTKALASLSRGAADLAEASARIESVTAS